MKSTTQTTTPHTRARSAMPASHLSHSATFTIEAPDASTAADIARRQVELPDSSLFRARNMSITALQPNRWLVITEIVETRSDLKRASVPADIDHSACKKCQHPNDDHYEGTCIEWRCICQ